MNLGDVQVSSPYAIGSGNLAVKGFAPIFNGLTFVPNQIAVYRAGQNNPTAIYSCTGYGPNGFYGLALTAGTDTAWPIGSVVMPQIVVSAAGGLTAVSIASANGFTGTSSGGTTPALTIVPGQITPTGVTTGSLLLTPEANPGGLANGSVISDSTQSSLATEQNGLYGFIPKLLYMQTADTGSIAVVGPTSLLVPASALGGLGGSSTITFPAGFWVAGKTIRCDYTIKAPATAASAAGTMTLEIKLGGNLVATSVAMAIVAATTNGFSQGRFLLCCKSVTTGTGSFDCWGDMAQPSGSGQFLPQGAVFQNGTTAGNLAPQTKSTATVSGTLTFDFQALFTTTTNSIVGSSFMITELC